MTLWDKHDVRGAALQGLVERAERAWAAAGPVNRGFPVTFAFSEAVAGFTLDDITVGNGSVANLQDSGTGKDYTADVALSGGAS